MKTKQIHNQILKNKYISSVEFYSQVIDSLQDYAIFTMDNEFLINSWNSGSTNIFGYEIEEVIGKPFDFIFTKEDINTGIHKGEIEKVLKEGKALDNRWHVCKDGSLFWAFGLMFPLIDKDGALMGYVKILRDLTERRKSEEAIKKYVKDLEELNSHKENILAILAHDLRSPLSGIIQLAELLKDNFETIEHDELKNILDHQFELCTNELSMLDYLLEWARVKCASEVFSPKKIELVHSVETVFKTLNKVADNYNITLHHEITENTRVFADEKMLLSILQNLVSNAIKYSKRPGTITISVKNKDDMILVQVKDTGMGMSKEIQEKIFTPQVKVLLHPREEKEGAGIGLLLVKGFLERNGGDICFESVEGEGTSFYFTLPKNKSCLKTENEDKIELYKSA